MATATDTINSATPVTALRTQIESVLTSHSTWAPVENITISTNTYNVWRCRGSGVANPNSWGSDFYVVLVAPTSGIGGFTIKACENWDATNDLMQRPVVSGSLATNADGSALATGGVVASTTGSSLGQVLGSMSAAPNTNEYYTIVTKNALWVGWRRSDTSSNQPSLYAGLFETFMPSEATEFPLLLYGGPSAASNTSFGSTASGGFSRQPKRISQSAATFHHLAAVLTNATPLSGDTAKQDLFYTKAIASRALIRMHGFTSGNLPETYGGLRGLLYDALIVTAGSGVTYQVGDTITIDGAVYYNAGGLGVLPSLFLNREAL
jgi:hypothetical protein